MLTLDLPEPQLRIRLLTDFLHGLEELLALEECQVEEMALHDRDDVRSLLQATTRIAFEQVSSQPPGSKLRRQGRRLEVLHDLLCLNGQEVVFERLTQLYKRVLEGIDKYSMVMRLAQSVEFVKMPQNPHEVYRQPALLLLWTGSMCLSVEQEAHPATNRLTFTSISSEAAKVLVTLKQLGGETQYVKSIDVYRNSHGAETSDMKRSIREELKKAKLIKCSGGKHGGMQLTVAGLAEAKSVETRLGSEVFS